jgi:hypothetical protein
VTTLEQLDRWRTSGAIGAAEHDAIAAIVRKDRFSVYLELNALLYVGVLAFIAGLGWTVQEHFASIGDAAVVGSLAVVFAGCLAHCFRRARPFSRERVESPHFSFDYILYLGCLVFGIELAFVEARFHLLQAQWDYYLLWSALLYFALAFRFDNRFVLSLALATMGAWFGVRLSWLGFHLAGSIRVDALTYAAVVALAGWATRRWDVKAHFLETFLHVAANAGFAAMISGVAAGEPRGLWLALLAVSCAAAVERGLRYRRFAFLAYGVVYGYIGLAIEIVRQSPGVEAALASLLVLGIGAVILLVYVSRQFGRIE